MQESALALLTLLQAGGFTTGGFNFDAKLRRQSVDPEDLFHAHVGGVDTLARGLLSAERLIADGGLERFVAERYAGWDDAFGRAILAGDLGLADLSDRILEGADDPRPRSGRQEMLENRVQRLLV